MIPSTFLEKLTENKNKRTSLHANLFKLSLNAYLLNSVILLLPKNYQNKSKLHKICKYLKIKKENIKIGPEYIICTVIIMQVY